MCREILLIVLGFFLASLADYMKSIIHNVMSLSANWESIRIGFMNSLLGIGITLVLAILTAVCLHFVEKREHRKLIKEMKDALIENVYKPVRL